MDFNYEENMDSRSTSRNYGSVQLESPRALLICGEGSNEQLVGKDCQWGGHDTTLSTPSTATMMRHKFS